VVAIVQPMEAAITPAKPNAEPVLTEPISQEAPIRPASKAVASPLTPTAAAASKVEPPPLASASTSKQPLVSQVASVPARRATFGVSPPSAAAKPSPIVARRGPPALAGKQERAAVGATPVQADVLATDLQPAKVPEAEPSKRSAATQTAPLVEALREPSIEAIRSSPAAISGEVLEPEIALAISTRPTNPPLDEPTMVRSLSDRPTDPPPQPSQVVVATTPSVPAIELEIAVALSEPAPSAQRSVEDVSTRASAHEATSSRTRPRIGSPLELAPARRAAPRDHGNSVGGARDHGNTTGGARVHENSAVQAAVKSIAPDIAVSLSEPAPNPVAPPRAPPRRAARVANPLDPAPRPERMPGLPRSVVASPSIPGLRVAPLTPQISLAEVSAPEPRRRSSAGALMLYGAAAVGCGLVLFQLVRGESANPAGGAAALGAVQSAAIVPMSNLPIGAAPVQPAANAIPRHDGASPSPTKAIPESAIVNRPAPSAHRSALEHESASEPGSAQALVDEGTALFKEKRLGLAEASYLKALKAQPGYPRAMAALVRVHIERRDGVEAVRWAKQLVDTQPRNGAYLLLLGDAEQLRGDLSAARDAWQEAADNGNATARERL
jgi:hypothetical protein